jgi:3',5'-cyclic AMP phosphodiesterase CpdA
MLRNALLATAAAFCLAIAPATAHEQENHSHSFAPWHTASPWPDRIVVTFAGDPARTLAVNWRTDASVAVAVAEIVRATPDARFDVGAKRETARTEALTLETVTHANATLKIDVNAGLAPVNYHSVLFSGLEPNTLYAYRVGGADGKWSEWFQVRTAPESGPVKFLYVGDAQNGILSHWSRTIRAAYAHAPDARFIIHAGDLVNTASRDYEWAQWFKAVGFIHGMVPAIPVAGNHEYFRVGADASTASRLLSILWRPQFRLPEEAALPETLRETVYAVRYAKDVDVFVLDTTNADLQSQAVWLDRQLGASTARWKVVTFHHPIFSSGRDRDNKAHRDLLLPILTARNVDLVLQGHDHTYARGAVRQTPERIAGANRAGALGPMFVNSVSGPKQYTWSEGRWANYAEHGVSLDKMAENTQFFQVIGIDGDQLTYEAYTADGQLYDRFAMKKDARGVRKLVDGRAATIDERRFANTAPYPSRDDLDK